MSLVKSGFFCVWLAACHHIAGPCPRTGRFQATLEMICLNRRPCAPKAPLRVASVAERGLRVPGRKPDQPGPPAWATPARVVSGFHAPSQSARRPKSSSAPGWSRGQNFITAKLLGPVPTSPAALLPRQPPRGLPALLSWPQAQLERRLQRPAGADQHSTCPRTNVSAIVSRMICCTHFRPRAHRTRASRHLRPQTASARFKPFAAANGSNHDLRCPVSTARCGLVRVIIIAINDSHREWRGSRVKKAKNFERGDTSPFFRPVKKYSAAQSYPKTPRGARA